MRQPILVVYLGVYLREFSFLSGDRGMLRGARGTVVGETL